MITSKLFIKYTVVVLVFQSQFTANCFHCHFPSLNNQNHNFSHLWSFRIPAAKSPWHHHLHRPWSGLTGCAVRSLYLLLHSRLCCNCHRILCVAPTSHLVSSLRFCSQPDRQFRCGHDLLLLWVFPCVVAHCSTSVTTQDITSSATLSLITCYSSQCHFCHLIIPDNHPVHWQYMPRNVVVAWRHTMIYQFHFDTVGQLCVTIKFDMVWVMKLFSRKYHIGF